MAAITVIVLSATIVALAVQLVAIVRFRSVIDRADLSKAKIEYSNCPPAAVILALRGLDPKLDQTLEMLQSQQYPNFLIYIVIDSPSDSVWPVIQRFRRAHSPDNLVTAVLAGRKPGCSLKCGALVQAVEQLIDDYEVFAFVDGDARLHPNWLAELVRVVQDEETGVATGCRVYLPPSDGWGSLVRRNWNAAGVVQLWLNNMVWAGSMAIRADVVRKIGILDAWKKALSVDNTVGRLVRQSRYQVRFVPAAILANTEDISLGRLRPWMERQMISARSAGWGKRAWLIIVFHGLVNLTLHILPLLLIVAGAIAGEMTVVALGVFSLALNWIGSLSLLATIQSALCRAVQRNTALNPDRPTRESFWRYFVGFLLTNGVYSWVLIRSLFVRTIHWRGVSYELKPNGKLELISDQPLAEPALVDSEHSVV